MDVRHVRLSVDFAQFRPGVEAPPLGIAFMSRRGAEDAQSVLAMLKGRGSLGKCRIAILDELTEREVSEALRHVAIFLSVSPREGFGLPVLEAMASGCYVVGYHAFGSAELMRPDFSSPVPPGDLLALAQALETALHAESAEPGWLRSAGLCASEFVRNAYSAEQERSDVIAAYSHYLYGQGDS